MDVWLALGVEGGQVPIKPVIAAWVVCVVEGLAGGHLEEVETFANLILGLASVIEWGSQVLLTSKLRLVLDVCGHSLNGAVVEAIKLFE